MTVSLPDKNVFVDVEKISIFQILATLRQLFPFDAGNHLSVLDRLFNLMLTGNS